MSVKLANDIYSLMSVLEGDDYSEIKDMLSNSRRKSIPCAQNGRRNQSKPVCTEPEVTTGEFSMLKDTVATLQADMLHMKQTFTATENQRQEQLDAIRNCINDIKTELFNYSKAIRSCVLDVNARFPELQQTVGALNSRISQYEHRLVEIEKFVGSGVFVGTDLTNASIPHLNHRGHCAKCQIVQRIRLTTDTYCCNINATSDAE